MAADDASPPRGRTVVMGSKSPSTALTCVSLMWAILLPPVGVALRGAPAPIVMINLLFTMLGYLPGQIHAILTIAMMGSAEQAAANQMQLQQMQAQQYAAAGYGYAPGAPPPAAGAPGAPPPPPVAPVTYSYFPPIVGPQPVPTAVAQQVADAQQAVPPAGAAAAPAPATTPAAPAAAGTAPTAPAAGAVAPADKAGAYPKI